MIKNRHHKRRSRALMSTGNGRDKAPCIASTANVLERMLSLNQSLLFNLLSRSRRKQALGNRHIISRMNILFSWLRKRWSLPTSSGRYCSSLDSNFYFNYNTPIYFPTILDFTNQLLFMILRDSNQLRHILHLHFDDSSALDGTKQN